MIMADIVTLDTSLILEKCPHFTYKDENVLFYDDLRDFPVAGENVKSMMYIFVLCMHGHATFAINGVSYDLKSAQAFICPPGHVVAGLMISPDFKCSVVCMTEGIIQASLSENMTLWTRALFVEKHYFVSLESDEITSYLQKFYEVVRFQITHDNPFAVEIMSSLLKALLLNYCGMLILTGIGGETPASTGGQKLFDDFMRLLGGESPRRHPVEYYAEKLCVTGKYLSQVCRKTSGKTALEWIHQYVTEDVRTLLTSTSLSIKEIAARLGFPNVSFFGKYVREKLGCSPREFRRNKGLKG